MSHIIAGFVQQQDQVAKLMLALQAAKFDEKRISAFYVNPPGQHDILPQGGDRFDSPGTKEVLTGVAIGASGGGLLGAALGVVAIPIGGPFAPVLATAAGAHIGSLIGSVSEMKDKGQPEVGGENASRQRKTGMMVAVYVMDAIEEVEVIQILNSFGALDIETSVGKIVDGDWHDFDPLTTPHLVKKTPLQ
ncbi:hypothetical protein H8K52_11690 [Undibacterium seohonense]|uniref:DUF1269 domain-containing protein n=1 Tax=Undibacterium seohonense TaxID=1344950 RepID=A0ABR6X4Y8_9BURK|nr:hypothetical protein [Undibacterium seohonense]MBC3808008.1 hypothetical protein [Undibacterium seohonense]